MRKKILLIAFLFLNLYPVAAVEIEVNGLKYEVISKTQRATLLPKTKSGYVIEYTDDMFYNGDIVIPEIIEYEGTIYNVTTIGSGAFAGSRGLTSVSIPNSIINIEYGAFNTCESLTSITIPNSVEIIDEYAFYSCTGLRSITIGNNVTKIGKYAFNKCSNLAAVYITDLEAWCKIENNSNPLGYAHHLFLNGEEIVNLVIPNTVTTIGNAAFAGCAITSVYIPNSVTTIGGSAFSSCTELTSVFIPNSVTTIRSGAFQGCTGLTTFIVPNSVVSINGVFENCSNLVSISLPNSISSIGGYTFARCISLASIDIPNSVKSIGTSAFLGCTNLVSIIIPNSVTTIEENAFLWCSRVSKIIIGNGVNTIGSHAFSGCSELFDVYCYAENVPSIMGHDYDWIIPTTDAFDDSYIEYATLHVPANSISDYKAKEPWKDFKEIVALTDSDPKPTGINEIIVACQNANLCYDLTGRIVQFPKKGIYVKNGKKYIKR